MLTEVQYNNFFQLGGLDKHNSPSNKQQQTTNNNNTDLQARLSLAAAGLDRILLLLTVPIDTSKSVEDNFVRPSCYIALCYFKPTFSLRRTRVSV